MENSLELMPIELDDEELAAVAGGSNFTNSANSFQANGAVTNSANGGGIHIA